MSSKASSTHADNQPRTAADLRPDLAVVLEEALSAAHDGAEAAAASEDPFEQGRLMAYQDVLSVAMEQAQLLGLTPAQVGLGDLDVDALLSHRRAVAWRRGWAAGERETDRGPWT